MSLEGNLGVLGHIAHRGLCQTDQVVINLAKESCHKIFFIGLKKKPESTLYKLITAPCVEHLFIQLFTVGCISWDTYLSLTNEFKGYKGSVCVY